MAPPLHDHEDYADEDIEDPALLHTPLGRLLTDPAHVPATLGLVDEYDVIAHSDPACRHGDPISVDARETLVLIEDMSAEVGLCPACGADLPDTARDWAAAVTIATSHEPSAIPDVAANGWRPLLSRNRMQPSWTDSDPVTPRPAPDCCRLPDTHIARVFTRVPTSAWFGEVLRAHASMTHQAVVDADPFPGQPDTHLLLVPTLPESDLLEADPGDRHRAAWDVLARRHVWAGRWPTRANDVVVFHLPHVPALELAPALQAVVLEDDAFGTSAWARLTGLVDARVRDFRELVAALPQLAAK